MARIKFDKFTIGVANEVNPENYIFSIYKGAYTICNSTPISKLIAKKENSNIFLASDFLQYPEEGVHTLKIVPVDSSDPSCCTLYQFDIYPTVKIKTTINAATNAITTKLTGASGVLVYQLQIDDNAWLDITGDTYVFTGVVGQSYCVRGRLAGTDKLYTESDPVCAKIPLPATPTPTNTGTATPTTPVLCETILEIRCLENETCETVLEIRCMDTPINQCITVTEIRCSTEGTQTGTATPTTSLPPAICGTDFSLSNNNLQFLCDTPAVGQTSVKNFVVDWNTNSNANKPLILLVATKPDFSDAVEVVDANTQLKVNYGGVNIYYKNKLDATGTFCLNGLSNTCVAPTATATPTQTGCIRPLGLNNFRFLHKFKPAGSSTIQLFTTHANSCQYLQDSKLLTGDLEFFYGQMENISLGKNIFLNKNTNDCTRMPNGYYYLFSDNGLDLYKTIRVLNGVLVELENCFYTPSTATSTPTSTATPTATVLSPALCGIDYSLSNNSFQFLCDTPEVGKSSITNFSVTWNVGANMNKPLGLIVATKSDFSDAIEVLNPSVQLVVPYGGVNIYYKNKFDTTNRICLNGVANTCTPPTPTATPTTTPTACTRPTGLSTFNLKWNYICSGETVGGLFNTLTQACEYGSQITKDGTLGGLLSNPDVTTNAGEGSTCTMSSFNGQTESLTIGKKFFAGVTTDCSVVSDGIYFIANSITGHKAIQVINGLITQVLECSTITTPTPTSTPTSTGAIIAGAAAFNFIAVSNFNHLYELSLVLNTAGLDESGQSIRTSSVPTERFLSGTTVANSLAVMSTTHSQPSAPGADPYNGSWYYSCAISMVNIKTKYPTLTEVEFDLKAKALGTVGRVNRINFSAIQTAGIVATAFNPVNGLDYNYASPTSIGGHWNIYPTSTDNVPLNTPISYVRVKCDLINNRVTFTQLIGASSANSFPTPYTI